MRDSNFEARKERAVSHDQSTRNWVFAAPLEKVREHGCITAQVEGHTLALFAYGDTVYAIDNRCPHMGFPLKDGSVKDGILTCHWHHARFDLASGGAFDLFADDVPAFPVSVRNTEVWVDVTPHDDVAARLNQRLHDGLERNLPLVIAKTVIGMSSQDSTLPFRIGLEFGTRYRQSGWGQGLTILTCMMNLLPQLAAEDRPRALYHGLSAVANDTEGMAPRFMVQPLPNTNTDVATLKRWLRQFIEVRDSEGAERCLISAVRAGASQRDLADMLFAAVTDHRYIQVGHPLDFTNKALEALDLLGWEPALTEQVLSSLVTGYAAANRMEESNAWRNPIDLVALLERTFAALPGELPGPPQALEASARQRLVETLLGDDPHGTVNALVAALHDGISEASLAGVVAYAAALRIARFHTSNEFGDWDTALHTFTFANAVHQGLRRLHATPAGRTDLLRGVFDAAMSIYLDRFLNTPAARIPSPTGKPGDTLDGLSGSLQKVDQAESYPPPRSGGGYDSANQSFVTTDLVKLFDRQQQVDEAATALALQLHGGATAPDVIAMLGKLLLREDRDFHTIQSLEAAVRQHALLGEHAQAADHVLIAAVRYMAAHAPTVRAQGQTFNIARRLAHGEHLFQE